MSGEDDRMTGPMEDARHHSAISEMLVAPPAVTGEGGRGEAPTLDDVEVGSARIVPAGDVAVLRWAEDGHAVAYIVRNAADVAALVAQARADGVAEERKRWAGGLQEVIDLHTVSIHYDDPDPSDFVVAGPLDELLSHLDPEGTGS